MSEITSDLKLYSSNIPIGHLLAEVSNGIHNRTNKSRKQPNINKLYHQNIASPSKMPKVNDRPIKDSDPDGSILMMEEWKSYALNPNEERLKLLAGKCKSITGVQPTYLTTFDDLAKYPAIHTELMKGFGLATLFMIKAHIILPRIYYLIFGASKGIEVKDLYDNNVHTA